MPSQCHMSALHTDTCPQQPCTHLDSTLVLSESLYRSKVSTVPLGTWPDVHQVVIATTGQVAAIWRPLESTHLLCVASKCGHMMLSHSDIMVVDVASPCPTAERRLAGSGWHIFSPKSVFVLLQDCHTCHWVSTSVNCIAGLSA